MKHRLIGLAAVAALIAALALAGCSSGAPKASTAAASPASSGASVTSAPPAAPAATASPTTRSAPTSTEFCAPSDGFCIDFGVSADTIGSFDSTTKTTSGAKPAREYGPDDTSAYILVYTPKESDPVAALKANRDWSWTSNITEFAGNPAILVSGKPDHPAPGSLQRNVCLKVAHGGKIYLLFIVSLQGLEATAAMRASLRFTA